jgi:DNA-binding MarR family transcriptional regulator
MSKTATAEKPKAKAVKAKPEKGKAPAVTKTEKAKTKPKAEKSVRSQEGEKAKSLGLTVVKFRVLSAIKAAGGTATYNDIFAKTGYYNNLTNLLRKGKDGSLSEMGLVKEVTKKGEKAVSFEITAKGQKLLAK